MSRPEKLTQKEQILACYASASQTYPLGNVNLRKHVAETLGLPLRTVQYYLQGSQDARKRYTPEECMFLKTATRKEIYQWAALHDRNPESVYVFAHRIRNAVNSTPKAESRSRQYLITQGFLDFSSSADLSIFGFKAAHFKAANTYMASKTLALAAPNYLKQPSKERFYALSLAEQCAILKNPAGFLADGATRQRIMDGWKLGTGMTHLVLERHPDSTHTRVAFASDSVEAAGKFKTALRGLLPYLELELRSLQKPAPGERPFLARDIFSTEPAPQEDGAYDDVDEPEPAIELDLDAIMSAPAAKKPAPAAASTEKYWGFLDSTDPDGVFEPLAKTMHEAMGVFTGHDKAIPDVPALFRHVKAKGGTLAITTPEGRVITEADLEFVPQTIGRDKCVIPAHWIIREAPKAWTFVTNTGETSEVRALDLVKAWQAYGKDSFATETQLQRSNPDVFQVLEGEEVVWTRR